MAFVHIELGNAELEKIIIAELQQSDSKMSTCGIIDQVNTSIEWLDDAMKKIGALRQAMIDQDFKDLPTLKSVNLQDLGWRLSEKGMVSDNAWVFVAETMRQKGFAGMLDHFEKHLLEIKMKTQILAEKIASNEDSAKEGCLSAILEENRTGNFKVEFAQLYESWAEFQQVFLASSMCSTELWYRFNKIGSLVLSSSEVTKAA